LVVASVIAVGAGAARSDGNSHHDGDDLPLYLSRTVDATAQDNLTPGFLWVGSGIPAANFVLKENLPTASSLPSRRISARDSTSRRLMWTATVSST
jgi:hypothetical protein